MNPDHCIVYVLINEAMPNFIKVGTTKSPIEERMRALYTTGVPVPFECHYAGIVEQSKNVERRIHRAFEKFRINKNREFFELDPEAAADIIRLVEIQDVTPSEDFVETPDDKEAIKKLEQRASRFNFKMVGIERGTILHFKHDEEIQCEVIDNHRVRFKNEDMSLSAAALEALKKRGFHWKAAQGAQFWTYNGQSLVELRQQVENEE